MTDVVKRRLSAIVSADVAGYSRLMEQDEIVTVQTIKSYRKTMFSLIQQHNGHIVDSPGDNILSEFSSVVDAIQCAVEIQHVIKAKNAVVPETRRMEFRIGISLEDIIEEEDRIYGDGVNIASRVEGLANAGGICISGRAYDHIANKLALGYEDIGKHSVKNISVPIQVYRIPISSSDVSNASIRKAITKRFQWVVLGLIAGIVICAGSIAVWYGYLRPSQLASLAGSDKAIPPSKEAESSLSQKPIIAFLPFQNISDDSKQEYFVDGMTDEIIAQLSLNSRLAVISQNSVFFYKDKQVKIKQVGKELGARYVVEGSVRKAGDRVRITAQMIDSTTDTHLWTETYDRELRDVFALQDEIAQQIVVALDAEYVDAEMARVKRIPTENMTAYDLVLRGRSYPLHTEEGNAKAQDLYSRAIEVDPNYAGAYTALAYAKAQQTMSLLVPGLEQAYELAEKAIALDDSDSAAHRMIAAKHLLNRPELAAAKAERAIALNPNDAEAYVTLANILTKSSKPEKAIEPLRKAMRLNPNHPADYNSLLGYAYSLMSQYDKAISVLKDGLKRITLKGSSIGGIMPSFVYHGLCLSYCWAGRYEEAISAIEDGLREAPGHPRLVRDLIWVYQTIWMTQESDDSTVWDKALEIAEALPENSPVRRVALGEVYLFRKQYDESILVMEEAISLNPAGWDFANICNYIGRPEKALEMLENAGPLSREFLSWHLNLLGHTYGLSGRHPEAIAAFKKVLNLRLGRPDAFKAHLGLTMAYAQLDRLGEAQTEAEEVLKLAPNFSVKVYGERVPYKDPALAERDMAVLRKAGLK